MSRWYDLIVILDDATSRDLLRAVGGGGINGDGDGGAEGRDRAQRRVLRAVQRSGSHFWLTPKVGGRVDYHRRTQGGAGVARVGSADDPGLLAASAPGAVSATSRLGGAACRRSCGCASWGRWRRRTEFLREDGIVEFNRRFQVAPRQRGHAFCALPESRPGRHFLAAVRTQRQPRQHGELSESELADRAGALAGDACWRVARWWCTQHLEWNLESHPRTALPWVAMTAAELPCRPKLLQN